MASGSPVTPAPGADRPLLEAIETEAQRALRARPSISVRTRISLGFVLLFVFSLAITIASLFILSRIRHKLLFLEAATSYTFEIQQARRFEKNYFLYGTNLNDALEHQRNAQDVLGRAGEGMARVIGSAQFETMTRHLNLYKELLDRLVELGGRPPGAAPQHPAIEAELREHGAEMVTEAEVLVAKERQSVDRMLMISERIPVVFLMVLLLLSLYVVHFLTRQMLRPLNRMMQATRRIAEGDFTPITPTRRYRDEFTELALAMNQMMLQLVHRQELLVQAHKLQAVGTLTAGIAHELNNPINNVMLTASMLLEDYYSLPDVERLDMAKDLVDEAERARRIVRNLLDFARQSEVRSALLDIREVVEETLRLVANQLKLANVKVFREDAPNLPPVHGDRQQLSQVFLNLVLNAVDAMPGGGILTIVTSAAPNGDFVTVEFADTGAGIPEHILQRVFDPFFTTKQLGKGTGLGLSVSLGILRKHGGDITVRSQPGKGSVFVAHLPMARVPARLEEPGYAPSA